MKLLLDIGNSSVNWATVEQEQFIANGVFAYDKNSFANSFKDKLLPSKTPSEVLVSNVAGAEIYNCLKDWVKQQWQRELWQASVTAEFKQLKNSYRDTHQMGVDRWLGMIASWEKYQSALCIVGCGTALTIDSIDQQGNHLGGYIIPGIHLMRQALVSNTEGINISAQEQTTLDYANDTQAAVNNGVLLATVAMIDRTVQTLSNASNSRPGCIITGGMAETIKPFLGYPFEHEPDLVLSGF